MEKKTKAFWGWLIPSDRWRLPVIIALGVFAGLVLVTFRISNATSYLSDDPKACVNCHIMTPQYATWFHSSHRERAVCNDCHVPHDNFVRKYAFKASDGLRHATMFTFRMEPQVIQIREAGRNVVQENCIRCHMNVVHPVSAGSVNGEGYEKGEGKLCWDCHREVPHGRVHSNASTPDARVPRLESVVPEWMNRLINTGSVSR